MYDRYVDFGIYRLSVSEAMLPYHVWVVFDSYKQEYLAWKLYYFL